MQACSCVILSVNSKWSRPFHFCMYPDLQPNFEVSNKIKKLHPNRSVSIVSNYNRSFSRVLANFGPFCVRQAKLDKIPTMGLQSINLYECLSITFFIAFLVIVHLFHSPYSDSLYFLKILQHKVGLEKIFLLSFEFTSLLALGDYFLPKFYVAIICSWRKLICFGHLLLYIIDILWFTIIQI